MKGASVIVHVRKKNSETTAGQSHPHTPTHTWIGAVLIAWMRTGRARVSPARSMTALDAVVAKFADRGIEAELIGLNRHAEDLHSRTSGTLSGH